MAGLIRFGSRWGRALPRRTAVLGLLLGGALLLGGSLLLPAPARAVDPPPTTSGTKTSLLAELRQMQAVRALADGEDAAALAQAARVYLETFPQGRYRDEVWLLLGQALAAQDETKPALAAYGHVIETQPPSPFQAQALAAQARLYAKAGQAERAQAARDTLQREHPRSPFRQRLLFEDGMARDAAGDHAGALERLSAVQPSALSPAEQTRLFQRTALAHAHLGQTQAADALAARYLARDEPAAQKAALLVALGDVARDAGRGEDARRRYQAVQQEFAETPAADGAAFGLAMLAVPTGQEPVSAERREQAVAALDGYLAREAPSHAPEALAQRAALHLQAGRAQAAVADHAALDAIRPPAEQSPATIRQHAAALRAAGQGDAALTLLAGASDNARYATADRLSLKLALADAQYRQGNCEATVKTLTPLPAFEGAEARQHGTFLRGACHYRLGDHKAATKDLQGLLASPAYRESAWPMVLAMHQQAGRHNEVIKQGRELLLTEGLRPTAAIVAPLLRSYEAEQKPAEGLALLGELRTRHPDAMAEPPLRLLAAEAELAHGDRERALAALLALAGLAEPQGPAQGGTVAPPQVRLEAVALLQAPYLQDGRAGDLVRMNARAMAWAAGPKAQAVVRAWLGEALHAWGQAALAEQPPQPQVAVHRLELAVVFLPSEPPQRRLAALKLLVQALQDSAGVEAAAQRYQSELVAAAPGPYRDLLQAELQQLSVAWAETNLEQGDPKAAQARLEQALAALPKARWAERYRIAVRLDGLYQQAGRHEARIALYGRIEPDIEDPALREQVRLYRSQLYRVWGDEAVAQDDTETALKRYRSGLSLLKNGDDRQRYELTLAMGQMHAKRDEPTATALLYERQMEAMGDPALKAQLRTALGQHYLAWAQAAAQEQNDKAQRVRYGYALDMLPQDDWRGRLAAAAGLMGVEEREGELARGAQRLAEVVATVPDAGVKQRYALYLGRVYREKVKDKAAARRWLAAADTGGGDDISVEAGFLLAEGEIEAGHQDAALKRLEGLAGRMTKDDKIRALYPRSIAEAGKQADAIDAYLRLQGQGSGITVPSVRGNQ
jgi:TolA-binding protein